jgi:Transmembrane domain of unknown function (DUF3566)
MTEGRNPQMTRSKTDRVPAQDAQGWGGVTTNTAVPSAAPADARTVAAGARPESADKPAAEKAKKAGRGAARRQPRRARLTLSHVNVYSVFKLSCVLALALFLVWLIVVGVLYGVLDVAGVFDKINKTVKDIQGDGSKSVVSGDVVFGAAIIIGVVNIVLFIALSTVGAMIYNLCADLVGGAEVTLSERE